MKAPKKVLSVLLALTLVLGVAPLALAEEPAGTAGTGTMNEQATSLDRTLDAKIVPEVAVNDPGRVVLKVEWVQPQLTFGTVAVPYTDLKQNAEKTAYADPVKAAAVLKLLQLDESKDAATITALVAKVNTDVEPLGDLADWYTLGSQKDVAFTLTNESKDSTDNTFKGTLLISAKNDPSLDIKGIEGVLTTPVEEVEDPDNAGTIITQQKTLELLSKTKCETLAADIPEAETDKKTAQLNAYINKDAYKYTYQTKAGFCPNFTTVTKSSTEGTEVTELAEYYKTTPVATDVVKDLTTTVTFTVKIKTEPKEETPAA